MTNKKAILYARVSGTNDPRTASLESQLESCEVYAIKNGFEVLESYQEKQTGAELWERLMLMEAMAQLRKHEADALICHTVDRLSRDPIHLAVVINEAQQYDYQLLFAHDNLPELDSIEGTMVAMVRGIAAKIQRLSIIEATRRGQMKRILSGKLGGQGSELYGYRRVDGSSRREIHPEEAAIVRQIYEWYGLEKIGTRTIGKRLHDQAIPTPSQSRARPDASTIWRLSSINNILTNPAYVGREQANRRKIVYEANEKTGRRKKRKVWREPEGLIPLTTTPPIVSEALWQAAQRQRKENHGERARNEKRPFLLRGLLFCKICNRSFVPHEIGNGIKYYRCYEQNAGYNMRCGAMLNARKFEAEVWEKAVYFLLHAPEIIGAIKARHSSDPTGTYAAALDTLNQRLTKSDRARDRLIEFLASTEDETMIEATREKLHRISDDRKTILHDIAHLNGLLANSSLQAERFTTLTELVHTYREILEANEELAFSQKRQILDDLALQIFCNGREKKWEGSIWEIPGVLTS